MMDLLRRFFTSDGVRREAVVSAGGARYDRMVRPETGPILVIEDDRDLRDAQAYLKKPIEPEALLQTLRRFC